MVPEPPADLLVGRDDELALLRACVADLGAGHGRSVWIEGEPGIGKSSLVAAALTGAEGHGCAVFRAAGDELIGRFQLRVLLDCLRVGPGAADPDRAEIAALLQGAGSLGAATAGDVIAAAAERLLGLVERLCAVSPVVLVLDDMQWADDASLAVWQRLHRQVRQLPLLLVAACRPVPRRAELAALRRGVAGPDTVTIGLGPLSRAEVADVVGRLLGSAPGPRLRQHGEQTGGNPLYLRELVDTLRREGLVRVENGTAELVPEADHRPPVSLATAIAGRLGFLSEEAGVVLRNAAVLGTEFTIADVAVLAGRRAAQLLDVVQEAVAAGVLVEAGDRLAFRHRLIRQALYEGLPASLRAALHRQAAQTLAAGGAQVAEVAEHLLAAPNVADAWMVDWVARAAEILELQAPEIAADLLRRVRASVRPEDPRRESIDASLATASFLLGRYDDVEMVARPVLARTQDPDVAGRMAWTLGYALLRCARHEQALAVTGAAQERGLTPLWTARVRAMRAMILDWSGYPDAESTALRAIAEGERAEDRLAVGYALHALYTIQSTKGDQRASLETIDRALAVIGEEPETTDLRLLLLSNRSVPLDDLGRLDEADRAIDDALALAERAGSPQRLARIQVQSADQHFRRGRWDEALATLDAAADVSRSTPYRGLWLNGLAALILCHRDDRAAAATHLAAADEIEVSSRYLRHYAEYLRMAVATAAERDGEPARALAVLRSVFTAAWGNGAVGRIRSHLLLPSMVRLATDLGDRAFAEAVTEAAVTQASRLKLLQIEAAAEHCSGVLAGIPDRVLGSADLYRDSGLPLLRAQALENAAVVLARRGDAQAATATSASAIGIYNDLGAAWDIRRATTRLREYGVRHGVRGRRGRPAKGWDALTPTELKIAQLIAAGRSNPDIAAELWLSRRTVQSHVSHILTKLGVRSRVEIARVAFDHRPSDDDSGA